MYKIRNTQSNIQKEKKNYKSAQSIQVIRCLKCALVNESKTTNLKGYEMQYKLSKLTFMKSYSNTNKIIITAN